MKLLPTSDVTYMQLALAQAHLAARANEVPVGAVLVVNNGVVASAHNAPISLQDCTAHAEVRVLREAGRKLENYRLVDATLFVTLEPCMMCLGAMIHARINRLVYGATDPKTGVVGGASCLHDLDIHNHQFEITGNVLEQECSVLLTDFFRRRRKQI